MSQTHQPDKPPQEQEPATKRNPHPQDASLLLQMLGQLGDGQRMEDQIVDAQNDFQTGKGYECSPEICVEIIHALILNIVPPNWCACDQFNAACVSGINFVLPICARFAPICQKLTNLQY
jgi:hypothetical protein